MSKKMISKNDFMKKIDSAPKHAMSLERKCISKEDLIEKSNYIIKIISASISLFLGLAFAKMSLSFFTMGGDGKLMGSLMFGVTIFLCLFIIRKECKSAMGTHIAVKDFKNENFTIYEDAATEKRRERVRSGDDYRTHYFVQFYNHDEIKVSFSDYDDVSIGDMCYIIINNTKKAKYKNIIQVYPQWKYQLPYEWRSKIQKV